MGVWGDLQAKVWEVIPSSADKPVVVINRGTVLVTEQANLPDLRNEGVADITGINIQPTHLQDQSRLDQSRLLLHQPRQQR